MSEWPKKFRLPEAHEFHKGGYDGPNGSHCALGWLYEIRINRVKAEKAWKLAADKVGIPLKGYGVAARNDHPKTTKKQLAKAFRLMAEKLSYEIHE